jgi:hypothetical protein
MPRESNGNNRLTDVDGSAIAQGRTAPAECDDVASAKTDESESWSGRTREILGLGAAEHDCERAVPARWEA